METYYGRVPSDFLQSGESPDAGLTEMRFDWTPCERIHHTPQLSWLYPATDIAAVNTYIKACQGEGEDVDFSHARELLQLIRLNAVELRFPSGLPSIEIQTDDGTFFPETHQFFGFFGKDYGCLYDYPTIKSAGCLFDASLTNGWILKSVGKNLSGGISSLSSHVEKCRTHGEATHTATALIDPTRQTLSFHYTTFDGTGFSRISFGLSDRLSPSSSPFSSAALTFSRADSDDLLCVTFSPDGTLKGGYIASRSLLDDPRAEAEPICLAVPDRGVRTVSRVDFLFRKNGQPSFAQEIFGRSFSDHTRIQIVPSIHRLCANINSHEALIAPSRLLVFA